MRGRGDNNTGEGGGGFRVWLMEKSWLKGWGEEGGGNRPCRDPCRDPFDF